jgi:hypothetical protein
VPFGNKAVATRSLKQENVKMENTVLCIGILFITQQCSMAQASGSAEGRDAQAPVAHTVVPQQPEFRPMSQAERLHHYVKSTFSLESVLGSAAGAGISQWQNTPSEWGQGAEGYGRRMGNSFALHAMRNTLMYGASSVLHEDNRYIPSGQAAFGARLKYSIASSFLARRDDGTRRLSYSRLGSYLATAFISREWQPHSRNGAQNAMQSFGTSMGASVGFNVAREFFPKVFRHHRD